jgi:hypothetical protein
MRVLPPEEQQEFIRKGIDRFKEGDVICDGENCHTILTPHTFTVHIPSEGDPLLLCVRCLHAYRLESNLQFKN